MSQKYSFSASRTYDISALESALISACSGNAQITHQLELKRLATSLWYDTEIEKQVSIQQNHNEPIKVLKNFRANLGRQKKISDIITSSRLMEITEPARAILIADMAYTFQHDYGLI